MAPPKQPDSKSKWHDSAAIILLRLIDSGLGPWIAVAGFLLLALWLATRNLESKDMLTLLSNVTHVRGLIWLGWIVAFVEIPILRWVIKREKNIRNNRLSRLEKEHQEALDLLKTYKQNDLKLEG